jgi:hypothetical protein
VGWRAGDNYTGGESNNVSIDAAGVTGESNTIRIADSTSMFAPATACFIGGISANVQDSDGITKFVVTVDITNDHLGIQTSGPNNPGGSPPRTHSAPQPRARPQRQAMLNDKVEKLQATVAQQREQAAQQQKQIETLTAQLREQAAQIRKVSAQIEVSKPAPQVVVNKP